MGQSSSSTDASLSRRCRARYSAGCLFDELVPALVRVRQAWRRPKDPGEGLLTDRVLAPVADRGTVRTLHGRSVHHRCRVYGAFESRHLQPRVTDIHISGGTMVPKASRGLGQAPARRPGRSRLPRRQSVRAGKEGGRPVRGTLLSRHSSQRPTAPGRGCALGARLSAECEWESRGRAAPAGVGAARTWCRRRPPPRPAYGAFGSRYRHRGASGQRSQAGLRASQVLRPCWISRTWAAWTSSGASRCQ